MGVGTSSPQGRSTGRMVERDASYVPRKHKQSTSDDLIINNRSLSPGDITRRLQELKSDVVRHFGVDYCYLSPTAVHSNLGAIGNAILDEVLHVLKANPQMESIRMRGPFPRHRDDLVDILEAMDQHEKLREIAVGAFYWAQLFVSFDQVWIDTVKNNQYTLERLSLDCFDLSNINTSMEHLCQALRQATNLTFLCFRNCHVTDEGFLKLVRLLIEGQDDGTTLSKLKTLHLACNTSLTTQSLVAVGLLVKQPHIALESIDLIGNKTCFEKPTETQLGQFLQALRVNTSLRRLSLVSCGIVDEIVKQLFEALKKNKTLRRLELDYNELTRETGMNHLVQSLPHLSLQYLGMCGLRTLESPQRNGGAQTVEVTSSWRCDGSFNTLARLRTAVSQNNHLISFHLDCSCCQRHCSSFLLRNEIRHTIETQLEPLSGTPSLHTHWMAKCPGKKESTCSNSEKRPPQQAQDFAEQRRLHTSTIYLFLLRNAHGFHPIHP
mmetsp:Transcript_12122/g.29451  ORF Transcript_12122/g.29451 Transcript_12122/m.29451 type:complete len:494 (-) Transcript_12122:54-1535(-)